MTLHDAVQLLFPLLIICEAYNLQREKKSGASRRMQRRIARSTLPLYAHAHHSFIYSPSRVHCYSRDRRDSSTTTRRRPAFSFPSNFHGFVCGRSGVCASDLFAVVFLLHNTTENFGSRGSVRVVCVCVWSIRRSVAFWCRVLYARGCCCPLENNVSEHTVGVLKTECVCICVFDTLDAPPSCKDICGNL